jgi:nitroimidazol reductase NimA-like FMN-containing flavoprotein (pyridoxamine 5'-phosphate oxidase superfamily)
MEHADYVYTRGMAKSDLETRLRSGAHGVLALADADDAYAVPLSYHYDGERLLLRVSVSDDQREKGRFIKSTETATFVCYEASDPASWSILVRGSLERWAGEVDEATRDEWFPPFRLFGESVDDVDFRLYELGMDAVTGRETVE